MQKNTELIRKIAEDYWVSKLSGYQYFHLSGTAGAPSRGQSGYGHYTHELPGPVAAALAQKSNGRAVNAFKIVLGCLTILAHRYSQRSDVYVFTFPFGPDGQRPQDGAPPLFVHAHLSYGLTVRTLMQQVHQHLQEGQQHADYAYPAFLERYLYLGITGERDLLNISCVSAALHHLPAEGQQGDFGLVLDGTQAQPVLKVHYQAGRYSPVFVEQFTGDLCQTILAACQQPEENVALLPVLAQPHLDALMNWRKAARAVFAEGHLTPMELLERQVEQTPGAVALVCQNARLTYRELNEKVNRLANHLIASHQPAREESIGLLLDRSEWLVIATLAVLKSGASYVPLDPEYPDGQKAAVLKSSKCRLVLTETPYGQWLESWLPGSSLDVRSVRDGAVTNPGVHISLSQLACTIYTSGTTGQPKGVMVEFGGLTNLLLWQNTEYDFGKNRNILQLAKITVDVALIDMLTALTNGLCLVVPSREVVLAKEAFIRFVNEHRVNFVQIVPGMLRSHLSDADRLPSLDVILCGGDRLSPQLRQQILDKGYTLYDNYGQTELTADVLISRCAPGKQYFDKVVANHEVYVLDENNQLLPVGAIGSICLAGPGVARGYVNMPDETARKFVPHPFRAGERVYKCGDLGRMLPRGGIEFAGRSDTQVKIRGFRVELNAIEQKLLEMPGVEECVVLVGSLENGEKYLEACLQASADQPPALVRAFLKAVFPDYMIPASIVTLRKLPVSANGKIDKKALLAMQLSRTAGTATPEMPRNLVEQHLLALFLEILPLTTVDVYDSFFEAGGHSLTAVQLISSIYGTFKVSITLKDLYLNASVVALASLISRTGSREEKEITVAAEQAHYALSNAQQRLWLLGQLLENDITFNVPLGYELRGDLDLDAVDHCFAALTTHYEILRTTFLEVAGEGRQQVHKPGAFPFVLHYADLSWEQEPLSCARERARAEAALPFDLTNGPLFRVWVLTLGAGHHVLLLNLHHIIFDGWSLDILTREFVRLYNARMKGESVQLPSLPIQYKDYAAWQQDWFGEEGMRKQREFWLRALPDHLPALALPNDYPRRAAGVRRGVKISRPVDPALAAALREVVRQQDTSLFVALQVLLKVLLHRCTGQTDIIVGTPVTGRVRPELTQQLGNFVNLVPLYTCLQPEESWEVLLRRTSRHTLDALAHSLFPFDELVNALGAETQPGRSPVFDVLFQLNNSILDGRELDDMAGLEMSLFNPETSISKYDLTFTFNEPQGALLATVEYDTGLFAPGTVELLLDNLFHLMHVCVADPRGSIGAVSLLATQEEKVETDHFMQAMLSARS